MGRVEHGGDGDVVLALYLVDGLRASLAECVQGIRATTSYQSLPVKTVLTRSDQPLYHRERIAIQAHMAVNTQPWRVLQPQPPVYDLTQVRMNTRRAIPVVMCERQVKHIACPHQMPTIPFDELIEPFRGQREDVERMTQRVEVEDVNGPALRVRKSGQVLPVLDFELRLPRKVVGALGLCEARKTGAGMDEVGEDLIDDLNGESF